MPARNDLWTDQAYRTDTTDTTNHVHVIEGIIDTEDDDRAYVPDNVTFTVAHSHDHGYVAHSHVEEWRPMLRMVAYGIEVT